MLRSQSGDHLVQPGNVNLVIRVWTDQLRRNNTYQKSDDIALKITF